MKIFIHIAAIALFLLSCGKGKSNDTSDKKTDDILSIKDSILMDSTRFYSEAGNTVINFLRWYKKNRDEISKLDAAIINFHFEDKKPYDLLPENADKYLEKLRSSGMLSETYLAYRKAEFKDCDESLEKNPQFDDIPCGFAFEPVLHTQEHESVFEAIDHPVNQGETINGDKAEIRIDVYQPLVFQLTKENGKWKINRID